MIELINVPEDILDYDILEDTVYSIPNDVTIVNELIKSYKSKNNKIEGKPRLCYMIASTDDRDMQDEVVSQSGMDLEKYFVKQGRIKWEHSDSTLRGAEPFIGFPIYYRKLRDKTLVIFGIYPESAKMKVADDAWNLIKIASNTPGSPPIGASIEGVTTKKHGKRISNSTVYNIVLTPNPINTETEVHPISKSLHNDIKETLNKGFSVEPSTPDMAKKENADALISENTSKKITSQEKKMNKRNIQDMYKGISSEEELRRKAKEDGFEDDEIEKAVGMMFGKKDKDKETEKSILSDIQSSIDALTKSIDILNDNDESLEKSLNIDNEDDEYDEDTDDSNYDEKFERIAKSTQFIASTLDGENAVSKTLVGSMNIVLKSVKYLVEKVSNTDGKIVTLEKSAQKVPNFYQESENEEETITLPPYSVIIEKSLAGVESKKITNDEYDEITEHGRLKNPSSMRIVSKLLKKCEV